MTAASNLLPLAPKAASASTSAGLPVLSQLNAVNGESSTNSNGSSSSKTFGPLLRPQALLLNSDVLVRANLAERLAGTATATGLTAQLQAHAHAHCQPSFTTGTGSSASTMATALQHLQQQQYQDLVNRHQVLIHLHQEAQKTKAARDIIGMGITVPNPPTPQVASAAASDPLKLPTSSTTRMTGPVQVPQHRLATQRQPQILRAPSATFKPPHKITKVGTACCAASEKNKKMMQFGKPLMAPPRLASGIFSAPKKTSKTGTQAGITTNNVTGLKRPASLVSLGMSSPPARVVTIPKMQTLAMPPPPPTEMATAAAAPPLKKRKVLGLAPRRVSLSSGSIASTTNNKMILSSEELEFVEAAQRLHHSPLSSPTNTTTHTQTVISPATMPRLPLLKKALKPPPSLNF